MCVCEIWYKLYVSFYNIILAAFKWAFVQICNVSWFLGNAYNQEERVVCAGYDNGDIKLFDLRNMSLRWETNIKNGVRYIWLLYSLSMFVSTSELFHKESASNDSSRTAPRPVVFNFWGCGALWKLNENHGASLQKVNTYSDVVWQSLVSHQSL